MVNQQILSGKWNEVRGQLKQKWGKLSDDDLRTFSGNVDQLVGQIQRKTGETREVIEEFLEEVAVDTSEAVSYARDAVQQGAQRAADATREGYRAIREGYDQAERTVKRRPGQSMAVAFGLGFVAGAGIAVLFRQRSCESTFERSRASADHLGRQILSGLSHMMPHR